MPTEAEERAAVVAEAMTWIGTPYQSNADVKGAGVDCGMLMVRVFVDTGLVEPFDPRPYPAQWHLHQKTERYKAWVEQFAHEIEGPPLAGDLVLCHFGNVFAHAAIVTAWPKAVHAIGPGICRHDDFSRNLLLRRLTGTDGGEVKIKFFSIWPRSA